MEKLILEGIGNDGHRYHYEFNKTESFEGGFTLFMLDLGFKIEEIDYIFEVPKIKLGEEEWKKLNVNEIKQELYNFRNKNFDVDLIFWEKSITLIVRTKKNKELIKKVEKRFKFVGE